jgi:hypothetical protein
MSQCVLGSRLCSLVLSPLWTSRLIARPTPGSCLTYPSGIWHSVHATHARKICLLLRNWCSHLCSDYFQFANVTVFHEACTPVFSLELSIIQLIIWQNLRHNPHTRNKRTRALGLLVALPMFRWDIPVMYFQWLTLSLLMSHTHTHTYIYIYIWSP